MAQVETPPSRPVATLDEVARVAGVSRATVSRVVNGSPKVSADVRRNVEKAIDRLGYVPNRAARSLVTRRSDSIALVITEPASRLFSDPFFPRLVRGVSAALSVRDLQLVLLMPDDEVDEQRTIRYLTAGHVDGVILVSLHGDDPLPDQLANRRIPSVVMGRPPRGVDMDYVDADNRDGARRATSHLVASGRQRIATITGPHDMVAGIDRLAGYRDALNDAGIAIDDAMIVSGDFTQAGGEAAMEQLLRDRPDLDAVFCASDLMAVAALGVLQASGRVVPQDVAVVGYDDSPVATTTRPALSSVRQPIEEMGREMVHLLAGSIERAGRVPRHIVLSTELIARASSAGRAMP
jgi:DNA-binding LacI/PurR family transcriptional regulator